jgi:hypothetical protein
MIRVKQKFKGDQVEDVFGAKLKSRAKGLIDIEHVAESNKDAMRVATLQDWRRRKAWMFDKFHSRSRDIGSQGRIDSEKHSWRKGEKTGESNIGSTSLVKGEQDTVVLQNLYWYALWKAVTFFCSDNISAFSFLQEILWRDRYEGRGVLRKYREQKWVMKDGKGSDYEGQSFQLAGTAGKLLVPAPEDQPLVVMLFTEIQ